MVILSNPHLVHQSYLQKWNGPWQMMASASGRCDQAVVSISIATAGVFSLEQINTALDKWCVPISMVKFFSPLSRKRIRTSFHLCGLDSSVHLWSCHRTMLTLHLSLYSLKRLRLFGHSAELHIGPLCWMWFCYLEWEISGKHVERHVCSRDGDKPYLSPLENEVSKPREA